MALMSSHSSNRGRTDGAGLRRQRGFAQGVARRTHSTGLDGALICLLLYPAYRVRV
jgi:hypothetical protein